MHHLHNQTHHALKRRLPLCCFVKPPWGRLLFFATLQAQSTNYARWEAHDVWVAVSHVWSHENKDLQIHLNHISAPYCGRDINRNIEKACCCVRPQRVKQTPTLTQQWIFLGQIFSTHLLFFLHHQRHGLLMLQLLLQRQVVEYSSEINSRKFSLSFPVSLSWSSSPSRPSSSPFVFLLSSSGLDQLDICS